MTTIEEYFLSGRSLKKKSKYQGAFWQFTKILLLITILTTTIPILLYFVNFSGSLSTKQEHWGAFGDFVGGILGTFFSLFALFFSIFSLYSSSLTTLYIQEKQEEYNSQNDKKDEEKFEREIELTFKQNKPFPYLEINKFNNETTLSLFNYGIGPLIITKSRIVYDNSEAYDSIIHLIEKKIKEKPLDTDVIYNSAPTHILPPNGSKQLLSIKAKGNITANFKEFQEECRAYLTKCVITIEYEDIFENKFTFKNAFSFLGT